MTDTINTISHYHNKLLHDTLDNPEGDSSISFINHLNYSKHEKISDKIRLQIISTPYLQRNKALKEAFASYNDLIVNGKFVNDMIISEEKKKLEHQRKRRLSVDFDHSTLDNDSTQDSQVDLNSNEDEDLSTLRSRLLTKKRTKVVKTFDEQLADEENKQEDILKDMFQFIQGIKDGAQEFNSKLQEDASLLKAAESGLLLTSSKLEKSSKNLTNTMKELSLWNALKFAGVVLVSFIICIVLILVFPKW
ncbi:hypothetical protein WICPIJ_009339 [Wickerhamomyces pijperi]|uniref:Protein transport protein USE1 n=1 Tax=Wickerhamomyces pijperi TaxID=599730 RepID=A0A9P8PNX9_WICPI|nr:hypothetical protein WICPIJ_009339 [Wickerhamomyces pijperi]